MRITTSGSFNNLEKYLKKDRRVSMDALGKAIVEALKMQLLINQVKQQTHGVIKLTKLVVVKR